MKKALQAKLEQLKGSIYYESAEARAVIKEIEEAFILNNRPGKKTLPVKLPEIGEVWIRREAIANAWQEVIIIDVTGGIVTYGPTEKHVNTSRALGSFMRVYERRR